MRIKEKQIEAQTSLPPKRARNMPHVERIEARLRVVEQIVTDGGAETAAQIEALRDKPRIEVRKTPMNQFEFVLGIILIVMVVQHLQAQVWASRRDRCDRDRGEPAESRENARLRDEVKQLKERLHVLERIAIDKENSLRAEIDELRDR